MQQSGALEACLYRNRVCNDSENLQWGIQRNVDVEHPKSATVPIQKLKITSIESFMVSSSIKSNASESKFGKQEQVSHATTDQLSKASAPH